MLLRDYQLRWKHGVNAAWASGARNVLGVLPCGAGKTIGFASILSEKTTGTAAIAHRKELVTQISLAMALFNIKHRVIGSDDTIQYIEEMHYETYGRVLVDHNAPAGVASIDTLKRRKKHLGSWGEQVGTWVQDEGHHILKENKWGEVETILPNAKGLAVTATAERADGKGLGRHHDGIIDVMVEGENLRWMLDQGYLTPYKIFVPPSDFDHGGLKVGGTGDITMQSNVKAVKNSTITGGIVQHYNSITPGKRGITFMPDVETAQNVANNFNDAGVSAACLSAKTPARIRSELDRRFRSGDIRELTNVDLFGEGYDLPALDVCSMGRYTESYGLYVQQFCRPLRPVYAKGYDLNTREGRIAAIAAGPKPWAYIIDHVGNVVRHGLPDAPRTWTLDRRQKRAARVKDINDISLRPCVAEGCYQPYEAFLRACPYCGHKPVPAIRKAPEQVDGVLAELDPETLARMRGDLEKVDRPPSEVKAYMVGLGHNAIVAGGVANRHKEMQEAQQSLRSVIAWWGGVETSKGVSIDEMQAKFFMKFRVDVKSAQLLKRKEAVALEIIIRKDLGL